MNLTFYLMCWMTTLSSIVITHITTLGLPRRARITLRTLVWLCFGALVVATALKVATS